MAALGPRVYESVMPTDMRWGRWEDTDGRPSRDVLRAVRARIGGGADAAEMYAAKHSFEAWFQPD